ncbi:hypothetical protein JCM19241_5967 [Vibrio ishigakensis]|uniref:Fibronectin type-III domain-containing protein n=1 Tax=Vibrio ishigakensis TaxID=1481914 RepID=A0A0B8QEN7_9VIBR|nr:hypothetical protein JCM19241_5967 [Vibrio ishigakensis]
MTLVECGRNPALQLLDFLTESDAPDGTPMYGMGIPDEYIDFSSFVSAANWCDANNIYSDGSVDTGATFADTLTDLADSAGLVLTFEKGQIKCKAEQMETMRTAYFDETNIISSGFDVTEQSSSNYFNVVNVNYQNTDLNYEEDTWSIPPDTTTDDVIQADGFIQEESLDLRMCATSGEDINVTGGHVKVLGNRMYNKAQWQKQVTFDYDGDEHDVELMDVIAVTDKYREWTDKPFRVSEISRVTDEENFNRVTVTATEYDDSIYTNQKDGGGGGNNPINPPEVTAPDNVLFELEDFRDLGSGVITVVPSWNRNGTRQEFQMREITTPASSWTPLGDPILGLTWNVATLQSGTSYEFRARHIDPQYGDGDWRESEPFVVDEIILPPVTFPDENPWNFDSPDCVFTWDDMTGEEYTIPANNYTVLSVTSLLTT